MNTACVVQDNISFGIWSQARDLKHLQLNTINKDIIEKQLFQDFIKRESKRQYDIVVDDFDIDIIRNFIKEFDEHVRRSKSNDTSERIQRPHRKGNKAGTASKN